jgi:DNA-directed RNA polymerase subunit RPC12/RpoP
MSDFVIRASNGMWHDAACPAMRGGCCKCGAELSGAAIAIQTRRALRGLYCMSKIIEERIDSGASLKDSAEYKALKVWNEYIEKVLK